MSWLPAPSASNASHWPSGETSIASTICVPLVTGVAAVVPTGAPDGIGSDQMFELSVNTEYASACPSCCVDTLCTLSPVVSRIGSPNGSPFSLSVCAKRSRLPSRSETYRRRSRPSHAGLVLR
jgi:hypothetical protein